MHDYPAVWHATHKLLVALPVLLHHVLATLICDHAWCAHPGLHS